MNDNRDSQDKKDGQSTPQAPLHTRDLRSYFALSQVPFEVLVMIGAGLLVDYFFETKPWATVVGAIFGLAVGFLHMITLLIQIGKAQASEDKPKPK